MADVFSHGHKGRRRAAAATPWMISVVAHAVLLASLELYKIPRAIGGEEPQFVEVALALPESASAEEAAEETAEQEEPVAAAPALGAPEIDPLVSPEEAPTESMADQPVDEMELSDQTEAPEEVVPDQPVEMTADALADLEPMPNPDPAENEPLPPPDETIPEPEETEMVAVPEAEEPVDAELAEAEPAMIMEVDVPSLSVEAMAALEAQREKLAEARAELEARREKFSTRVTQSANKPSRVRTELSAFGSADGVGRRLDLNSHDKRDVARLYAKYGITIEEKYIPAAEPGSMFLNSASAGGSTYHAGTAAGFCEVITFSAKSIRKMVELEEEEMRRRRLAPLKTRVREVVFGLTKTSGDVDLKITRFRYDLIE